MDEEKKQIYAHLSTILGEMFEIEASVLRPNATLRGALMMDSINLIDLAIRLEAEYGLPTDLEEYQSVSTLNELVILIARLRTRPGSAVGA